MKILMLCHKFPNPHRGDTLRPFNIIYCLSKKYEYEITLLYFVEKKSNAIKYEHNLEKYCYICPPIEIEVKSHFISRIIYMIRNMISIGNIFSNDIGFLNYYYTPDMQYKINKLLNTQEFDAIYTDGVMAHNVENVNLPKIVEPLDAISESRYELFTNEKKPIKKLISWLEYVKAKNREKQHYKKFNFCNVVTETDKFVLESESNLSNVAVIPNGVDISYFKPMYVKEEFPSLIYVGVMDSPKNVRTILNFYNNIYHMVLKEYPNIKFYIVGSNPTDEIRQLSRDKSIIVTDFVDDIRPYLARASVAVVPIKEGTGIKNKVLDAMAMRKPVITTSIGAMGIEVIPDENIIISDDENEFARRIIELLKNERLREKIAINGRKLIERRYSWERTADELNIQFREMVHNGNS